MSGPHPPKSLPSYRLVPPNARQKLAAALNAHETTQNNKKNQGHITRTETAAKERVSTQREEAKQAAGRQPSWESNLRPSRPIRNPGGPKAINADRVKAYQLS
jgi:hypothetical protein